MALENLLWTFFPALPWVFVGLAAFVAWQKNKKMTLALQAAAAGLAFAVPLAGWLVLLVLHALNLWQTAKYVGMGFQLLAFLAFLGFAAGYCWERFVGK
jgi:hypothetical protein